MVWRAVRSRAQRRPSFSTFLTRLGGIPSKFGALLESEFHASSHKVLSSWQPSHAGRTKWPRCRSCWALRWRGLGEAQGEAQGEAPRPSDILPAVPGPGPAQARHAPGAALPRNLVSGAGNDIRRSLKARRGRRPRGTRQHANALTWLSGSQWGGCTKGGSVSPSTTGATGPHTPADSRSGSHSYYLAVHPNPILSVFANC